MRKWITILQEPQRAPLWNALVGTLRTDSSAEARLGDQWDHHLCRYILVVVVSEDNANAHPEGRSQTRQAVNNAIKRELACPTESGKRGKSSKSKTFRELFREKCRAGEVTVPPPPDGSNTHPTVTSASTAIYSAPSSPRQESNPPPPRNSSPHHSASPQNQSSPQGAKQFPTPEDRGAAMEELQALRTSCPHTDEWGQTSWWELVSDDAVHRLPHLLADYHLYELRTLLLDFRWIVRTFRCVDYSLGMRQLPTDGYDLLLSVMEQQKSKKILGVDFEGYRLIRTAIMLILPILKEDDPAKSKHSPCAHLATQLTGRLLNLKRRFSNIACLLYSIELHASRPWLRPLSRCFQQPRTDIKLAVPSNGTFTPHLIKLSEDGKILVTSGTKSIKDVKDSGPFKVHMIRVWDVESGKCMVEGCKVFKFVRQLSLTRDNSCIIFETADGLFFWHMQTTEDGTEVRAVEASPKTDDVTSITPTVHPDYVLTTHRRRENVAPFGQHSVPMQDRAVISWWDTQQGVRNKVFHAVTSNANCIDVSSNGELFASGHDNGFIHLWNPQTAESGPVLSFQNAGDCIGPRPVLRLDRANDSPDASDKRTISLSFLEKDGAQWVAAVSSDDKIRIWKLPPAHLIPERMSRESRSNEYLSTLCRAVIRRPSIRQVEWSQKGWLYSGGDDGMACEWESCMNKKWRWYSIDKNRGERMSEISTSLISVGRRSGYVATFLTKSPYVVVWDMGKSRETGRARESAYRSHCAMKGSSVDVTDIQDLTALRKTTVPGGVGRDSGKRSGTGGMSAYAVIGEIRGELEVYFQMLDPKMTTRPIGAMQPRLEMEAPNESPLEVCFEQPVMSSVSGSFITDESGSDWVLVVDTGVDNSVVGARSSSVGDGSGNDADVNLMMDADGGMDADLGMDGIHDGMGTNLRKLRRERRGMVAALQDGSVALFELEGADDFIREVKPEVKVEAIPEIKAIGGVGTKRKEIERSEDKDADNGGADTEGTMQGDNGVGEDDGCGFGGGDDGGNGSGGGGGGEGGEVDSDSVTRREPNGGRMSKRRRAEMTTSDVQNGTM